MTETAENRFDRLIRPHFDALFRAAYRLTGNTPDAEDLVQDVCVRAFPKLNELQNLEYVKGYLLRVQYRLFVDNARRRRRSPLRPMSDEIEASDHMISREPGPDEHVDALLANERLQRVWPELERAQQALLALHVEGYSLSELEHITGLSKNVLTARLHRARTRLAKLLKGKKAASCLPIAQLEN